jgi:hypothetical protein
MPEISSPPTIVRRTMAAWFAGRTSPGVNVQSYAIFAGELLRNCTILCHKNIPVFCKIKLHFRIMSFKYYKNGRFLEKAGRSKLVHL